MGTRHFALCPCFRIKDTWSAYCQYLKDWADSHIDAGFEGCCPSCYEEFLDGDYESEGETKP